MIRSMTHSERISLRIHNIRFPNWYGDQLLRRFQSTGAGVVPSQSPCHLGLYADG